MTFYRDPSLTGTSALRCLLMGHPDEFIAEPVDFQEESDRDFLIRQAMTILGYDDGRGPAYLNAAEYTRIREVWLEGKERPAVVNYSPGCWTEIRKSETRL